MKNASLSEETKKLIKEARKNPNLPVVRKVAVAQKRAKIVMLVALFVSCFSLSVFIGFYGPFMLFE